MRLYPLGVGRGGAARLFLLHSLVGWKFSVPMLLNLGGVPLVPSWRHDSRLGIIFPVDGFFPDLYGGYRGTSGK